MFSKYEGIDDIISKYAKYIYEFINEWNFDEVSIVGKFRINVRTKSILSITSSKMSCLIQMMFSIIKFIRHII